MAGILRQFPAFAILLIAASMMMLVPCLYAAALENWAVSRVFLYHAIFFVILAVILGLATMNARVRTPARYHLMTLLLAYAILPLALGAPVATLLPQLGLSGAYFEMLSSLTTTGATLIDAPRLVPESVQLWRSLVGWTGGFLVLVTAFAILAPLNLGGFEIRGDWDTRGEGGSKGTVEEASHRILGTCRVIAPAYAMFTSVLALLLIFAGDRPFVAICHAMAALSTSGISPVGGLEGGSSGRLGEAFVALFLLLAVSHRMMSLDLGGRRRPGLRDPEVQLMLIAVLSVTTLLFLRSFVGAAEVERQGSLGAAARALWGGFFTNLSFLTTTGFESGDWQSMRLWSNLPSPGVILLGLAVMGGGIATTAGGVKLLRLFALYRHGVREMDLLIHPRSVPLRGAADRQISRRGPQIAFIFLMLFLISLAVTMIALSAVGVGFDQSLALAIATLTTTGPAIRSLGEGLAYSDLDGAVRVILCIAMIVGRMEALVIFALFNPAFWRQ